MKVIIPFFFVACMAKVSLASIHQYKNNTKSNLRQRNQVYFTKNDESHTADSSSFELLEYDIANKSGINEERNLRTPFLSPVEIGTRIGTSLKESSASIGSSPISEIARSLQEVWVSQDEMNNFDWVNDERTKTSLQPLDWSFDCIVEAQRWSRYMARTGRLRHRSPISQNIDEGWSWLAENISRNPSVGFGGSHTSFMNSPSHRDNILNPDVNRFGIGVYKSGQNYWTTQIFKQVDEEEADDDIFDEVDDVYNDDVNQY
jgi:uncharacterized protein YkwD